MHIQTLFGTLERYVYAISIFEHVKYMAKKVFLRKKLALWIFIFFCRQSPADFPRITQYEYEH